MSRRESKERWFEVPDLEIEELRHYYLTDQLVTHTYPIASGIGAYHMRYDSLRSRIARMLNTARLTDLSTFKQFSFDIWLGQRCTFGHYVDTMFVTLAGTPELPPENLLEPFRAAALTVEGGRHPVADGGFLELKIRDGTAAAKPTPTEALMQNFSRFYRSANGLRPDVRDPYIQMALGASEPVHFRWLTDRGRMNDSAIELIPTDELFADHIPEANDRDDLVAFGFTFDPLETTRSFDGAWDIYHRVEVAFAEGEGISDLTVDDLRVWLLGVSVSARKGSPYEDDERVAEVIAELRRRLPSRRPPDPLTLLHDSIPGRRAPWTVVGEFALSFNGYTYWGSLRRCQLEAERVKQAWHDSGSLPDSLLALRTALFFEHGRWCHHGDRPDRKATRYVRALIEGIRAVLA